MTQRGIALKAQWPRYAKGMLIEGKAGKWRKGRPNKIMARNSEIEYQTTGNSGLF